MFPINKIIDPIFFTQLKINYWIFDGKSEKLIKGILKNSPQFCVINL